MKTVQAVKCEMCVFSERDGVISQLYHTQVKKMEATDAVKWTVSELWTHCR